MVDSLGTSTYSYDVLNRMVSHTDPFGKTIGYGYNSNGNRTSLAYPGSKTVNYSYDVLNRLSSVTDWLTNITSYAYDDAGKLTTATTPNGTTANYSYDTAGRLTGLSNKYSDASIISSYTYTLDAIGNHTSAVKDEPLLPILTSKNITYTYDAENRLINEGGTTQFYDANGNLTAKGSDNFLYDYEDRLKQSNIGGVITQYGYDGLGNRLSKTKGSSTTKYVLDINRKLANVIAETDNAGTITAYYVYGLGLISKVLPDGTAYYYHYDSRGSTIALSDAAENLTDTYAYGTFGNLANSQGTTVNQFKYVGRYGVMDEGNGLNYIRARYYSPEKGRFITKDPQTGNDSDGQSLNRYIYALNNPVTLIDISGFSPKEGAKVQELSQSSDWLNNYLVENIDTTVAGVTPKMILPEKPNNKQLNADALSLEPGQYVKKIKCFITCKTIELGITEDGQPYYSVSADIGFGIGYGRYKGVNVGDVNEGYSVDVGPNITDLEAGVSIDSSGASVHWNALVSEGSSSIDGKSGKIGVGFSVAPSASIGGISWTEKITYSHLEQLYEEFEF